MILAIISDTHIRTHTSKFESMLKENFSNVDMIIHAGDYTSNNIIDILKNTSKFLGVYGNNDNSNLRSILSEKEIITLEGFKIGLYHGHGSKKQTLDNVYDVFKNDKLDIIIYGHSHKPTIFTKGKTLFLNPGSCTSKRKEPWYSYIILEIKKGAPIIASLHFYK